MAALAAKQADMAGMMTGDSGDAAETAKMEQQKTEYAQRGISLSFFDKATELPHLINMDDDPFRSERFMYIFDGDEFTFGPGGNMRPPGMTVVRQHCKFQQAGGEVTVVAGKGATWVNGANVASGASVKLANFDRIVLGSEVFVFKSPPIEDGAEPMAMEDIIEEYQKGMLSSGVGGSEGNAALAEQMAAFEEEKKKWQEMQAQNGGAPMDSDSGREQQAMLAMEKEIAELMPKTKQLKQICDVFNRE